jgi:hypothetical protein
MNRRPTSLREVAEQSDSITDFGLSFTDWLHELRRFSSRPQLERSIAEEPALLRRRFPEGGIADAWLAAYAELLAFRIRGQPPDWAFQPERIAEEPWFSDIVDSPKLRALALAQSPPAFKRRNLFALSIELPLRLHRGRPIKSQELKRKSNAERQRRFRARRKAELKGLRDLVAALGKSAHPARDQ